MSGKIVVKMVWGNTGVDMSFYIYIVYLVFSILFSLLFLEKTKILEVAIISLVSTLLIVAIIHPLVKRKERLEKSKPRLKIKTKDADYIRCPTCGLEQWIGYDRCQKCNTIFTVVQKQ